MRDYGPRLKDFAPGADRQRCPVYGFVLAFCIGVVFWGVLLWLLTGGF